ncbi:MAG: calcium-binding protein [Thermoleophilaceae bacterium]
MRVALAAVMLSLAIPACAAASTVKVVGDPRSGYEVLYTAADGEVNDLTASGDSSSVTVTDPGATIGAQPPCVASDSHTATCTLACSDFCVSAKLGDQKDHFTSEGPGFTVDGGSDNDTLDGGAGFGSLSGGADHDVLTAGAGASSLLGGEGDDELNGGDGPDFLMGGPGADAIDGGGSPDDLGHDRDAVSYRDHTQPVTIDLSQPGSAAGSAGEGDTVTNVENAYGGAGSDDITATDELTSDGYGSSIVGFGGNDVIHGGPGRDELFGETGNDTIHGGPANDTLGGGDGRDTLDGEGGFNRVLGPEHDSADCGDRGSVLMVATGAPLRDVIDQSCRRFEYEYLPIKRWVHSYPGTPTRAVSTALVCHRHCVVTIELHAHGKLLGAARREVRRGHRGTLTVPLTQKARDELAQAGELKVGFSMHVKWGPRLGHISRWTYQLLLHDPAAAR